MRGTDASARAGHGYVKGRGDEPLRGGKFIGHREGVQQHGEARVEYAVEREDSQSHVVNDAIYVVRDCMPFGLLRLDFPPVRKRIARLAQSVNGQYEDAFAKEKA
jgi:hypothetical protein